ncbi:outer membrane lipoprotein-sorting protein [Candidatus Margulisiibacteriota bacterium]
MKKILVFLILLILASASWAVDIESILEKSDQIMRGDTMSGEYDMTVVTPRWTRTVKMKSWSQGTKKSFILITYPQRDKGSTFLKINNEMWQYVPRIERTIKIPPSMMLQSWMGSDFTNDDLVKESSVVEDYNAKLLSEDDTSWKIELIPKPQAAVTWGKVIMYMTKKTYLPSKEEFYDEDGELVREMTFGDVVKLPDRYYPTKMVMIPKTADKAGHTTTVIMKNLVFNAPVKAGLFSLGSLKSMSQ